MKIIKMIRGFSNRRSVFFPGTLHENQIWLQENFADLLKLSILCGNLGD